MCQVSSELCRNANMLNMVDYEAFKKTCCYKDESKSLRCYTIENDTES